MIDISSRCEAPFWMMIHVLAEGVNRVRGRCIEEGIGQIEDSMF